MKIADTVATIPISRVYLQAATVFAATDDLRYYLNGVLVQLTDDAVRIVGTDGRAIFVAHQQFELTKPRNPSIKMIIPVHVCKLFARCDDVGPLRVSPVENGTFKLESNELSVNFTPIDGTYIDYENVALFPPTTSGETAQFDPQLMVRFGKAATILSGKSAAPPHIAHNGHSRGAIVTFQGQPNVIGVLMPMELSPGLIGVPKWLKPRSAIADLEDASGNLPGMPSEDEIANDKPLATAGDAERASAAASRRKRSRRTPVDKAMA